MAVKTTVTLEAVTTDGDFTIRRLKVSDGWIFLIEEDNTYNTFSTEHVTDPEHQWIPTDTDDA